MQVHDKVKKLRLIHGYTQEAFADLIGRETSTFGKLERGTLEFRLKDLELIAKHFNMNLDELLHYNEEENTAKEGGDKSSYDFTLTLNIDMKDYSPYEVQKIINELNSLLKGKKYS